LQSCPPPQDVSAATLFLTAKPTGHARSPRQVLTVFSYLSHHPFPHRTAIAAAAATSNLSSSSDWSLPEPIYLSALTRLYTHESHILHTLAFHTTVALPHGLCINYLQTLDMFSSSPPGVPSRGDPSRGDPSSGQALARRSLALLNTALLSPQLLYLTHQPPALATAAIYLAARQVGVSLPETEGWEVCDVGREELGFLVVALGSTVRFVEEEMGRMEVENGEKGGEGWNGVLTVEGMRRVMLERRV
jgi:hypothetical protein